LHYNWKVRYMKFVKNIFGLKSNSKRKGITPVIAIVLLLMMTVAAAGMAYVWIMGLQEDIQEQSNEGVEKQQRDTAAAISIVSAWNDTTSTMIAFTIKNTGTYTFSADEIAQFTYYFNGVYNDGTAFGTPCVGLGEPGSVCQVVSDEGFPATPGRAGQVNIKVDPPFGSTSPYSCATKTASDNSC